MNDDISLSERFDTLHKQLYHTITQYGTACLHGDKENAKRLLGEIKEILVVLSEMTMTIERLENLAYETQSILNVVEADDLS